jgi:mannose-6-phosphate isomerase
MSRTPWGGSYIGPHLKRAALGDHNAVRIGESWEFSLDPAFPSKLLGDGTDLADFVARHEAQVFSPQWVAREAGQCDILLKLLDAAEPLSVQVHPADDDPDLAPGECGKPESWLILHAEHNAGIYLGFSRPVSKEALRAALIQGDQAKELLHFVPVKPGDYFELEPGVPHAIGAGVTLLEPQRIRAGLSGKTFRLWDWGRLYGGKPRELHLEQGLKLIDPMRQVGEAYVDTIRRTPEVKKAAGLEVRRYPPNPYYQTTWIRLAPDHQVTVSMAEGYGVMSVLGGTLTAAGRTLPTGQSALLPHAALPCTLRARDEVSFVLITPSHASPQFLL